MEIDEARCYQRALELIAEHGGQEGAAEFIKGQLDRLSVDVRKDASRENMRAFNEWFTIRNALGMMWRQGGTDS